MDHFEFVDFETCMRSRGWERLEYVPYDTAVRSRDNWRRALGRENDYDYSNLKPSASAWDERDPYEDLNE